ncbi:DUF1870 family protein [Haematospirillum jordaniae]|uniref:HTH cro/C1-type domain-containing protein n=1 Tax=Haematospirillum jordaniae TaxID=1549855 RepID=A0A143DDT7_9PROT|nr:DUF1870 family protein [Haematospirillum jordaniae]AMW34902.1 hypothetical protein AY555_06580 [Haematospirillum jordaniae]NKD67874.1 DUF1870 family protein [Haematospirillum jordaniae]NKD81955.1 DUF1870 family protein [Haematospirillum jordaniae]NKD86437.1 DUF1870 family protein [Haematospirillum jordaniae]NKD90786.1 DUF1870 family protein [Haematospirillum jordaniae]
MTPAELKTIRETLGLKAQWVADQAGVRLRTAQYWETGRMAVPADVASMLLDIDRALEDMVAQSLAKIEGTAAQHAGAVEVILLRYRTDKDLWEFHPDLAPLPASTHAAMLARLCRALSARSIPTVIQYMEPDEYWEWLGDRPDTEAARSEWSVTLPVPGKAPKAH